jgi:hypothetical protein
MQRFHRWLLDWARFLWFRCAGLVLFRRSRLLWRPIINEFKNARIWRSELRIIEAHLYRYEAAPYRPRSRKGLSEEDIATRIASAAAAHYYYRSNLLLYRRTIVRLTKYLEDAFKREPPGPAFTGLRARNFHQQATVAMLDKHMPEAASLHAQAAASADALAKITANPADKSHAETEKLLYSGCTICARMHTFDTWEEYFIDTYQRELQKLGTRLSAKITSTAASDHDEAEEVHFARLYNAILQCKAEAHRTDPNPDIIESAVRIASDSRKYIFGDDTPAYDAAIYFYNALIAFLRGTQATSRNAYQQALIAFGKSPIRQLCLIQVPESLSTNLAKYAGEQPLDPNSGIKDLSARNTRRAYYFMMGYVLLGLSVSALPRLIEYQLNDWHYFGIWVIISFLEWRLWLKEKGGTLGFVAYHAVEVNAAIWFATVAIAIHFLTEALR